MPPLPTAAPAADPIIELDKQIDFVLFGKELSLSPTLASVQNRMSPQDPVDYVVLNRHETIGPLLFRFHPGSERLEYDKTSVEAFLKGLQAGNKVADMAGAVGIGTTKVLGKAAAGGLHHASKTLFFLPFMSEAGAMGSIIGIALALVVLAVVAATAMYVVVPLLVIYAVYRFVRSQTRAQNRKVLLEAVSRLNRQIRSTYVEATAHNGQGPVIQGSVNVQ